MRRLERAGRVCASHAARSPGNSPSVNAHASRRGALKRVALSSVFSHFAPRKSSLGRRSRPALRVRGSAAGCQSFMKILPWSQVSSGSGGGTTGRTGEGGSGGVKDNRMRRSACALFTVTWHSRFLSSPPISTPSAPVPGTMTLRKETLRPPRLAVLGKISGKISRANDRDQMMFEWPSSPSVAN